MLQAIRERSQGLIVAIIVGFIILTFALWGIESYISAGRQVVVAEVEGQEILLQEFQEHLQRFRQQAQSMMGDTFKDADWDSTEIKTRALEQLVDERLLASLIEDTRIRISDRQVAMQLQQIPAFQDENGFSRQLYEQRLPTIGLTQAGFERELRNDIAKAQLRAGIAASEFVTKAEAQGVERYRLQKRDIGYAIISAATFGDLATPSEAEVQAYFEAHKETYRVAERVRLEYIQISAAALEDDVRVDDAALHAYYDNNKASFAVEEERNVNHILIHVPADADPATADAALGEAQAALQRARAGEPFEDLAKELSDDVGSSTEGGETGMFGRGVMAPEFEDAAFALAEGQISEPVRTKFGYHIIKLKAIKPGGQKSFDDVRDDVERAYRVAEAQKLFFEQAEQFSNLVYEHPDGLDVAAEALALESHRTELLTRAEIADEFSEKVAARAFETEVLVEGLNGEPVELEDGRVVAIRVFEHKPSAIPAFADVASEVREAFETERLKEKTAAAGDAMIERLRAGETVAAVIEGAGYDWQEVEGAGRDSDDVNRAVLRSAFRTAVDGTDVVYTGLPIGKSDYAVVRVGKVETPAADGLAGNQVDAVQLEMLGSRAALTWQGFVDALRAHSDVKILDKNL
ncbi:MAG: SurA N-terminal domain-containing protein [Gammaproteobacteria bacterium]